MSDFVAGQNTISNSRYPVGKGMPEYIVKAKGSYVWDNDNRKYIDWTASLGTVIKGYEKVKAGHHCLPLKTGSEEVLAKMLCSIYPADKARFFKNGSDATDAAIRLARHYMKRNIIASSGYHGWHDCFINTYGRHNSGYLRAKRGVPERNAYMGEIDWDFHYWRKQDLETVVSSQPACVIIEPLDRRNPSACTRENLVRVQDMCKENDILFIVDEILSGFRIGKGGVTELYGLKPDLVCLGKAMSNGCPLSALVGKKEVMDELPNLFVTGTYFTDDLSFRQAIETISGMDKDDFVKAFVLGAFLVVKLITLIEKHKLEDLVTVKGFGPWLALDWKDKTAEYLFLQEIIKNGILTNRDYFVMFSHTEKDVDNTVKAHDKVFSLISENRNDLEKLITITIGE